MGSMRLGLLGGGFALAGIGVAIVVAEAGTGPPWNYVGWAMVLAGGVMAVLAVLPTRTLNWLRSSMFDDAELQDRAARRAASQSIGLVLDAGNVLHDALNTIGPGSVEDDWAAQVNAWYATAQDALRDHQPTSHLLAGFQANRTYRHTIIRGKPEWAAPIYHFLEDRMTRLTEIQAALESSKAAIS